MVFAGCILIRGGSKGQASIHSPHPSHSSPTMYFTPVSESMHKAEMAEMKGIKKELKSHEGKPASKAHKGLKSGGVAAYKTGGVIEKYATGGVIQKFKNGGLQDDGKAVKYPKVPATKPPYITKLADTHKKGGRIAKKAYGGAC